MGEQVEPVADPGADPGLAGVVPFRFSCHRCGHCCTGGEGHVWLEDGESEAMAAALGIDHEAFERLHVRAVPDPREPGRLRRSLREQDEGRGGRCTLLEGQNHCSVYAARPAHCRTFPYWPSVMETEDGFEATFQVTFLAHFLLTELLLPSLRASHGRVAHAGCDSNEFLN